MAAHDMFLAMILKNAQRAEAKGIVLTVDEKGPRIDMLLLDGSSRPVTSPPADVVQKMIESLEKGQRDFRSTIFIIVINDVKIQRGATSTLAHISSWKTTHVDEQDDDY
jgi:hypothetical protein